MFDLMLGQYISWGRISYWLLGSNLLIAIRFHKSGKWSDDFVWFGGGYDGTSRILPYFTWSKKKSIRKTSEAVGLE